MGGGMSAKRYTQDQVKFILDNYLDMPIKRIATHIKGSYTGVMGVLKRRGLTIPKEIIERNKKQSQFNKGIIPHNKGKKQVDFMSKEAIERTKATRFQKGIVPHNTKYNGHERITKDGYIEVRIKQGTYRLKHIHNWEKLNGKLPKGHCLWCLDGNIKNTNPNNWELITRRENLQRNVHDQPPELLKAKKLITRINKEIENE